ncbi:hypothetical protein [Brevundimonas sp.]|uniref:hypothetical protein n=1 Tax=Brevundimonas sp. TaxID=1871086 RepID=UPI0037C0E58F
METEGRDQDRVGAEGRVLDRLWRGNHFGEPPCAHAALKRELLNRIGVLNARIDALIDREIEARGAGAT